MNKAKCGVELKVKHWLLFLLATWLIGGAGSAAANLYPPPDEVKSDALVALVVTVANYKPLSISLRGTARDGDHMAAFLKKAGYEVTNLADPGRAALINAIVRFSGQPARKKLFYFSGNAGTVGRVAALFPSDMDPDAATVSGLELNAAIGLMQNGGQVLMVVIDSQPFGNERNVRVDALGPNSLLAVGAAPGFFAFDTPDGGEFTNALLEEAAVEDFQDVYRWPALMEKVAQRMRKKNPDALPWLIPAMPGSR